MKNILTLIILLFICISVYPQKYMIIHKQGSAKDTIAVSVIDSVTFKTIVYCGIDSVTYAGKTYHTVKIGNNCWLKENLNVGTMISTFDTTKNNGIIEKYCYNGAMQSCETLGGLYSWNEAMQYSTTPGTRGICPAGWHLPTYADFQSLITAVDSSSNALKAVGQGAAPGAGTNTSGFTGLLAGDKAGFSYSAYGYNGYFLNSTELDSQQMKSLMISKFDNYIFFSLQSKDYAVSVRCVLDK